MCTVHDKYNREAYTYIQSGADPGRGTKEAEAPLPQILKITWSI
jgi:hypothetical protein